MEKMNIYFLRVTEKNSKPVIWRDIIVPAGITFSELSVILNALHNEASDGCFLFENFSAEIQWCDTEDAARRNPMFDWQEAFSTYISDWLEPGVGLTYFADSGIAYRIEVKGARQTVRPHLMMLDTSRALKALHDNNDYAKSVNDRLDSRCRFVESDKPRYETREQLLKRVERGDSLPVCLSPRSREDNLKPGTKSYLKAMGRILRKATMDPETKWLNQCLNLVPLYYGKLSMDRFYRLYKLGGSLPQPEMEARLRQLMASKRDQVDCALRDNYVVDVNYLEDPDQEIEDELDQKGKPYYMPSREEVVEIAEHGYTYSHPGYVRFRRFLEKRFSFSDYRSDIAAENVWSCFVFGFGVSGAIRKLEKLGVLPASRNDTKALVDLMVELNNTTCKCQALFYIVW